MADYYTQVSTVINLDSEELAWALVLYDAIEDAAGRHYDGEPLGIVCEKDETIQKAVENMLINQKGEWKWGWFDFDVEGLIAGNRAALWIGGEESVNLDMIADYIQAILSRFDSDRYVTFEWANTCSKPRPGAFGGGAYLVTKSGSLAMGSSSIIDRLRERAAERGWITNEQL